MRNGTLGSITGRDEFIIAEALATALVALEQLPTTRQPTRNIADMKMLLNSLYPPPDVSIHLTTARDGASCRIFAPWCARNLREHIAGPMCTAWKHKELPALGRTPT
jgi:hypothetical protein